MFSLSFRASAFRNLFNKSGRNKRTRDRLKLELEHFEDRIVPTSITWQGASGAAWSVGANWVNGIAPGAGDVAVFDGTQVTPGTVNVDSAQTVAGILFSNSTGTPFTISGSSLNLETATISLTGTTPATISVPQIVDGSTLTIDVASGATLTDVGNISGNAALAKNNSGTLILGGTNSYTGGTSIAAGSITLAGTGVVPAVPSGAAAYYSFDSVTGTTVTNSGTLGARR